MTSMEVLACAFDLANGMESRAKQLRSLCAPHDLLSRVDAAAQVLRADLEALACFFPDAPLQRNSGVLTSQAELYPFALDNAVDGCIFEYHSFQGAVAAATGLPSAAHELLARMLVRAQLHAELGWDVHHWCLGQLSPQRGRNIRAAQHDAVVRLIGRQTDLGRSVDPALQSLADRIDGRIRAA